MNFALSRIEVCFLFYACYYEYCFVKKVLNMVLCRREIRETCI